jgi:hypothetical protein
LYDAAVGRTGLDITGKPKRRLHPRSAPTRRRIDGSVLRRTEALRLRVSGLTIPQVAAKMGVTVPCAYEHVQLALDDCAREIDENARRFRALELNRLDGVIAGHWDAATGLGSEPADVHAAAIVIKAVEARSKLLGLFIQLDPGDRSIAIADIQALLLERQRQALERAKAAGIAITLPYALAPVPAPPEPAPGPENPASGDDDGGSQ